MICWHRWTKWEKIAEGIITRKYNLYTLQMLLPEQQYESGQFEDQRRECKKCGKSELRRVTASL